MREYLFNQTSKTDKSMSHGITLAHFSFSGFTTHGIESYDLEARLSHQQDGLHKYTGCP